MLIGTHSLFYIDKYYTICRVTPDIRQLVYIYILHDMLDESSLYQFLRIFISSPLGSRVVSLFAKHKNSYARKLLRIRYI